MSKNQNGFAILFLILGILGVAVAGGASYYVYSTNQTKKHNAEHPDDKLCENGTEATEEGLCAGATHLKPAIYLYPTKIQDTKVELDYDGELLFTYPDYDQTFKGWNVVANPDGTLTNKADSKGYSYLFWEGKPRNKQQTPQDGFVVKGSETKDFLQNYLPKIGLNEKEYNEMIVFWLPKIQNNKYNFIHFASTEYTDVAKLKITPQPDAMLRVFMVVTPLNNYKSVPPQVIMPFERKGFTVVEWGGTLLDSKLSSSTE